MKENRSSLKRLKIALPAAAVFALPWTHKLVYLNLLAAWPGMDHASAHFFGGAAGAMAFFATMMIAEVG